MQNVKIERIHRIKTSTTNSGKGKLKSRRLGVNYTITKTKQACCKNAIA